MLEGFIIVAAETNNYITLISDFLIHGHCRAINTKF